ncbi:hypothetical protein [Limnobacter parvus]|uniref:Uncharacterized protein n=1 Tax=Limnobacter parvus TaxID=2939690 RepID=A0ABT1XGW8_9BURK|nr:hypothetical protein [Limnobacter parvus]MCR2746139.1 hypothetical protein [Limnobacter parvus]
MTDEWLGSTIVCLSAARHAVSLQLNAAAAGLARSTGTHKAMHSESTRELAKSFQELITEIDRKVRTLARRYKNTDPNCDKLDSKLYELIDTAALPIRTYLSGSHQLNVNRPKPVPIATPAFTYVSPPVSPMPTIQHTRQTAVIPVTRKISLARKLISRVKRALNM